MAAVAACAIISPCSARRARPRARCSWRRRPGEWGVPVGEVTTEPGAAVHKPTGRKLPYGQLVDKASQLPVPQNPKLKTPDQFRYIGKETRRRDTPSKVNGSGVYGMDVQVPGMLIASIERCPVFGGKVQSFDATAAKQVPGVKHVVQVSNGIAVVADGFWSALNGRKALKIVYDNGPHRPGLQRPDRPRVRDAVEEPGTGSAQGRRRRRGAGARRHGGGEHLPGALPRARVHGAHERHRACARRRLRDLGAHAEARAAPSSRGRGSPACRWTRSPCTPHCSAVASAGAGSRISSWTRWRPPRRSGVPVKVIWTREDDIQHGFYRPATYNVFRAALDGSGKPEAWWNRVVGPGIIIQKRRAAPGVTIDPAAMEGVRNMPYEVPNVRVEWVNKDFGIPLGFWRSVGPSQNAFIVESFVDELAHAAGKDPVQYRLALLGKSPRHRAVLELAALKSGWGAPLPPGRGRGIAVAFSYGSYAAHVAEVSVSPEGKPSVHKIVGAIDCGIAVNPDQVRAQMEGGAIYALTAALYGEITIEGGRVKQSNFHDYPMLRINESPVIEAHILDSGEAAGGLGEPGVPTVAPAVCNAIFALTGKRVRRLPIRTDELKRA